MLHAANQKNYNKAVEILKEYGATEQPDSRGITPSQRNHCPNCSNINSIKEMHEITDYHELYDILEDIGKWEGLCVNLGVPSSLIDKLRYSSHKVSD